MRLDKLLAHAGYGTRKEVKVLIRKKRVSVNDEICTQSDFSLQPQDIVCVDNKRIQLEEFQYLMLHKPAGVLSATQDDIHTTVLDLIEEPLLKGCFPVGRLDIDTEGLLLITNDGKLAHRLLSPKKHVEKTYFVILKHSLQEKDIHLLEQGMDIGNDEKCLPAKVEVIERHQIYLTICEGKYHQIKRMMKCLGNEVCYLKRLRMGPLLLDASLAVGKYRFLTEEEIEMLKALERNNL
ncbi:MAG: rRNA pseudouridine synthase [Erysipelotrichaceae bacterium]|nr:rRNA pseudouridine synthase [Erysipelotrichaceae bacterium]